jgi:hypothetical protein
VRWRRDELRQIAEVLGSGCYMELVYGAVWTSQAQSVELQDAFEVREQISTFFRSRRDVT